MTQLPMLVHFFVTTVGCVGAHVALQNKGEFHFGGCEIEAGLALVVLCLCYLHFTEAERVPLAL